MQNILYIVEKVYHHTMWVGAVHGKRNIDHGVCSGLIILQALTFFHELVWGFDRLNDWPKFKKEQDKGEFLQLCIGRNFYAHYKNGLQTFQHG